MRLVRPPAAGRAAIVFGWLIGLACFVYLLALPPTLNSADESFILYGAKRVYQGQALYHDFFDFLTPGSFYLYALAYAIGGVSITSARVTTCLLNALSAVCVYFLSLQVASAVEAAIAALLVVVICVPVWNMASHHWIATACALASAAVLLAPRWQASERARPLAAGMLGGLLVCTHQNRGVWLILWLVLTVPLLTLTRRDDRRWRRCLRELVWTALGGALVCVPVLGFAVWRASLAELLYATHTWVLTNYRNYNVGTIRWAGYGFWWAGGLKYTSLRLMQAVPWLLGLEAATLLWGAWRYGLHAEAPRAALLLLALSAVAAISYFPDYVHIAFALPFVLIVLAGLVYRARTALVAFDRPAARTTMRLVATAAVLLVLWKGWTNVGLAWQANPVLFETAYGTLANSAFSAGVVRDLREKLHVDDAAPPRIFSYPTDAWLYLAVPADNPTPFALLRPVYNTPEQFQEAIDRLERDPKALVLVNSLFAKADDPFMTYLNKGWRPIAPIGPGVIYGEPLYHLYERTPSGASSAPSEAHS